MPIDPETAKEFLNERKSNSSNNSEFYWAELPDTGSIKIRFLPGWVNSKLPGKIISKHWNIPEHNDIICFNTWKMECPICLMLEKYRNIFDTSVWDKSSRSYTNVLIKDNPKYDPKQPYILRAGDYNLYWLVQQIMDVNVGDITDPVNGHDVIFTRKSFKGAFDRTIVLAPSPIASTNEEIEQILNKIFDLDKIWRPGDDEYYKKSVICANIIEKVINERLLSLKNSTAPTQQYYTPQPTPAPTPTSQPIPTPTPQPVPAPTSQPTPTPQSESVPTTQSQPIPQTESVPQTHPTPQQQPNNVNKPPKSPECYGTDYNVNEKKCIICAWEFNCAETFRAANPQKS